MQILLLALPSPYGLCALDNSLYSRSLLSSKLTESIICSLFGPTNLTVLECWNNKLTSLNTDGAILLDRITCANNELTTIDINIDSKSFDSYDVLFCHQDFFNNNPSTEILKKLHYRCPCQSTN